MSKHILIVPGVFPTLSETFIVNHITALIKRGFNVSIFSKRKGNTQSINNNIIKYKLLDLTYYQDLSKPTTFLKKILKCIYLVLLNSHKIKWNLLKKCIFNSSMNDMSFFDLFYKSFYFLTHKMPEIIHVHFGHNAILFCDLKKKGVILEHVKIIVTFHGFDLSIDQIENNKIKYRLLRETVSRFIVNSDYLLGVFKQTFPGNTQVSVIPVWPDLNLFSTLRKEKKNDFFNIVFCGRLIELKGCEVALDIVELLFKSNYKIKFHVIGDGDILDKLIEISVNKEIDHIVTFHNSRSQKYIKTIFSKSQVFLLPGIKDPKTKRAETQGLVLQEAQASGLPVLVSDVGGMKYGMVNGETGFVLKERDAQGFADKIIYLIENNDILEKMSISSVRYVKENFQEDYLIERIIKEVYQF